MQTDKQFQGVEIEMVEVKGRTGNVVYWAVVGVVVSLLGWWALGWVGDLGTFWEIFAVSLLISGVVVVGIGIWKAFDKRPILVADADGLLERTSLKATRVPWNEIEELSLVTLRGRNPDFLAVRLKNPEQFIKKGAYGTTAILEQFHKDHGTPFVIALRLLDAEPHALLARLKTVQISRTDYA